MTKKDSLVIERTIHADIKKVWAALTETERLKLWQPFFTEFKPEVGFEAQFWLGKDVNNQYLHLIKVTEVIPGKKLTYSWRYDAYQGDSYVTYELFPSGEKTKLIFTYKITQAFPDNPDFSKENYTKGWTWAVDALQKVVER